MVHINEITLSRFDRRTYITLGFDTKSYIIKGTFWRMGEKIHRHRANVHVRLIALFRAFVVIFDSSSEARSIVIRHSSDGVCYRKSVQLSLERPHHIPIVIIQLTRFASYGRLESKLFSRVIRYLEFGSLNVTLRGFR